MRRGDSAQLGAVELLRKLPRTGFSRSRILPIFMSRWFRDAYRLVSEREIHAILDASGFAYKGPPGLYTCERIAAEAPAWKRQGKKLVFLPQAFGPFSRDSSRSAFRRVVEHADLVFARDRESYEHLVGLGAATESLRLAPDFTNLVAGALPTSFPQGPRRAAVVPNLRMIKDTGAEQSARYIPFLVMCIRELQTRGVEPFLLVHSTGDEQLTPRIQQELGMELEIVREDNPVFTKGILGTCCVAVASRYHALASCLAQGVPCIGTGWCHKYRFLFEDYECPEYLLPVDASSKDISGCLEAILEEPMRGTLLDRLVRAAGGQRDQVRAMWAEIDTLLGLGPS